MKRIIIFILFIVPSTLFSQVSISEKVILIPESSQVEAIEPNFVLDSSYSVGRWRKFIRPTWLFSRMCELNYNITTSVSSSVDAPYLYYMTVTEVYGHDFYYLGKVEPGGSATFAASMSVPLLGGQAYEYGLNPRDFGILFPSSVTVNATGDTATFLYAYNYLPSFLSLYGSTRVIKKADVDHFAIKMEKDTIAFTEVSSFSVQAKDANDQSMNLDPAAMVRLSISTNDEYGTFITQNGDTLKTSPVLIENVPYSDANSGSIRFAAVRKNPDSVVTCTIHTELQNDAAKKGDTTVIVVEQTLKIVMEKPYEVRPSIPTEDQDTAKVRVRKKQFEVRMTRGGSPVANHPFRLKTDYVRGSGGHAHGDTKDSIRIDINDNYGFFQIGKAAREYRPFDSVTNSGGKFNNLIYNSSIFGDTMRIYLRSLKDSLLCDSLSMTEIVADLHSIPSGNNHLITYTSTNINHHLEDSNFGLDTICYAVDSCVQHYAEEFGLDENIYLAAIDMSLPYGGKFDINGLWTGPHDYHRNGKSIDFSHTYRDIMGRIQSIQISIDGQLVETTNRIDDGVLDYYFDLATFDRYESNIGKIHYEYNK